YMAVSSKAKSVMLRDLRTGEWKALLPERADECDVWSIAFSSDSSLLASADSTGAIHVWELVSGKVRTLDAVEKNLRAVAFHPSGKMMAIGCGSGRILWCVLEGEAWVLREREFSTLNPTSPVRCLAFSSDGKYLSAGRGVGTPDLYALADKGKKLNVLASDKHEGAVSALAFSPGTTGLPRDETRLVTASFDGTLRLWKVPSMEAVGPPFTGHVGRVLSVAFSADKRSVVSGGTDKRAILWDSGLHVAQTMRSESAAEFGIAFSPDGKYSAVGFDDWKMILQARDLAKWPEYSLKTEIPMSSKNGKVPVVAFSSDGLRLATTTREGVVRVFDLAKADGPGEPPVICEIPVTAGADGKTITALCLSDDGTMIAASVSEDGALAKVSAWKVATREPLFTEPLSSPRDDWNFALKFSPDGSRLVTGGKAERAVIWNLRPGETPEPKMCAEEHTGTIRCVAFSPDGKMFATASGDNTLILWDTETRKRLSAPLAGHRAPVLIAAFSPNGKLLASGSDDHSVILWDVETRQPAGRLNGHTDSVRAMAFSKDGKQLYTGSWDEESRKWELDAKALGDICRERANRNLGETEWTDYMLSGKFRKTWPSLPTPGEDMLKK
ncbi:MAG: WD40 repeat domain-containing protein, partial [Chthoniobacteraceae bacterium]